MEDRKPETEDGRLETEVGRTETGDERSDYKAGGPGPGKWRFRKKGYEVIINTSWCS